MSRGHRAVGIGLVLLFLSALPSRAQSIVRQPYLQLATPTGMTVVWRTSTPTDSRVRYGTTQGSLTLTAVNAASVTNHVVTLSSLSPGTKYFYDVGSSTAVQAGGTAEHYFTTSPTPGSTPAYRVWVVGDSGTGDSNQAAVRDAMLAYTGATRPNLMLHVGDIAYTSGTEDEFTNFHFEMYKDIIRHTVQWTTLGNHEGASTVSGQPGASTGPYYDAFVLPAAAEAGGTASGTEAYYSFDYGNTHFISLNAYQVSRSATGPMALWLQNDLASTSAQWVIAFWHHPPYSHGTHNSDSETELREMRENLLPILEAGGVDLVLCGHSHDYERSYLIDGTYSTPTPNFGTLQATGHILDDGDGKPGGDGAYQKPAGVTAHNGAVYVVAGHGGAGLGGTLNHPVMYFSEAVHGSVLLDVSGSSLTLTNLRRTGVVSDTFTIVKGPQSPKVASTLPAKSAVLGTLPSIQVTFTTGVTGVDAADLTVNGSAATTLSGAAGSSVYTFGGFAAPGSGHVGVVLAPGGIADAGNPGLQFTGNAWSYTIDTTPPHVATESPQRNRDVGVLPSITVNFSKAVTGVAAGDLQVNGQAATSLSGISGSSGPYTFTGFPAPGTGQVSVTLQAGAIEDELGQPFAGDAWIYVLRPHLLINEYLTSNNTAAQDEFGEFDDYVEIYNPANVPVDMSGMHLTDTLGFPAQYAIPNGVVIPAKGYLTFWCDSQPGQGPRHTNFNLARDGESVGLFDTDENGFALIDSTSWTNGTTDVPSGRFPDGAPGYVAMPATPGAANTIACTTPAQCSALTDACNTGVCSANRCQSQPANEGAACDDGIACRAPDTCSGGVCDGGPSLCTGGEVCNLVSGVCETPAADPLPITQGASWSYFKGSAAPPADWNEIAFDDSTWLVGNGGFGYGTDCSSEHGTVLSDMLNGYVSLYVRHLFRVDNPAAVQSLQAIVDYDDAFVAYINGHEVARSNVVGTPPGNAQVATADHECSSCNAPPCNAPESLAIDLATAQLQAGNNVLAIQAHNLTAGSSDFTLVPTLTATIGEECGFNPECDDDNPCTDDSCVAGLCEHAIDDGSPCSDGIACTSDVCSGGTCVSTSTCPAGQTCNMGSGTCDLTPVTVTFQQGVSSYTGTVDTFVNSNAAQQNADNSAVTPLVVDGDPDVEQALLRFDGIFGGGAGQIPLGATIQSATLTVNVTNPSATGMALHRMLAPWSATSSWSSLGAGVTADGVEAVASADASTTYNGTVPASFGVNVTSSLAAWSAGTTNLGWAFLPGGTDSIQFDSADVATATLRPRLSVTYTFSPPCGTDADCDDNNLCNGTETCVATVCQPGTALDCNDGNPCTTDSCSPSIGCLNANNTNPCSDGDACTAGDACSGGTCVPGGPASCDDGNVCTDDSCNSATGCVHDANTASCDDGDLCTTGDACSAGTCAATPLTCPGGQSCNPANGQCEIATAPPLPIAVGDTWRYFKGTAEPAPPPSPPVWAQLGFDDATWLTGPSGFGYGADCTAQRGTTLSDMQNPPASPGYLSLYVRKEFSVANPAAVTSLTVALDYDDSAVVYVNGVEVARSASMGGTVGTPTAFNTAAASGHECSVCDGPPCNPAQSFPVALGAGGSPLQAGTNVIAIHAHNQNLTSSDFTLIPSVTATFASCTVDAECDDGVACTDDACSGGSCSHTSNCGAGQTCNLGSGACDATPATVSFQQGVSSYTGTVDTFVNSNAAQQNADNSAVTPLVVDGDPDVEQALLRFDGIFGGGAGQIPPGAAIQSATLTVHVTNASVDGMALHRMLAPWSATSSWSSLGAGISADGVEAVAAADASTTYNGTVPASFAIDVTGSLAAWSAGATNLGWACLPNGTDSIQFDSADVATVAFRPSLSVTYTFTAPCGTDADCSDGNLCNGIETCVATVCQPGSALDCDDTNPCTDDSCLPATGCQHANNTAPCSDGNLCTTGDVCASGSCQPGGALSCDDGNVCTDDTCVPATGCQHANNTAPCSDGNLCTTGDVCSGGACAATPVGCPAGQTCNPGNGLCETSSAPPLPIAAGDTWRYFKGTAEPAPPPNPPTWATIGYDDAAWLSGPSGFGYGPDCTAQRGTTLTDMQNPPASPGYFSIYVRRSFSVTSPAAVTSLSVGLDYDDSAIVYINGQEVARTASQGGTPGTPTAFNAPAGGNHECSVCDGPPCNPAQTFPITLGAGGAPLVAGTNVIAIHAHNQTVGSSDFTLVPTVTATFAQCVVNADCDDGVACTDDTCTSGTCSYASNCPVGQTCNTGSGVCEVLPVTASFRDGVDGYAGTQDTYLSQAAPGTVEGALDNWRWDLENPAPNQEVGLIRFDGIFGSGPGQIPPGSTINSATLTLQVTNATVAPAGTVNEAAVDWSEATATWNNFGGEAGVQADEYLASPAYSAPLALGSVGTSVTASLQAWSDGLRPNYGWVFRPANTDGAQVDSAEFATVTLRPQLTVTYVGGCASSAQCDDGNLCNGLETCVAGQCQAGTPLDCNDGNPCTTDSCDPGSGCQNVHNTAPCDDGNVCTVGDACAGGVCTGGAPASCDDGIACTADSCLPGSGCQHANACPGGGTCNTQTGACTAGRMECAPSGLGAIPGSTVDLTVILRNLGGLVPVRGYQTQVSIVRTSGTGSLTVDCPGGVVLDDTRPDYLFSGSSDDFFATNCALRRAASSLLSGGVTLGATPAYLSHYHLHASLDATAGSTFEISLDPSPGAAVVDAAGQEISMDRGASCTVTIGSCQDDAECDDGNPCTVDTCSGSSCMHVAAIAGTVCRPAAGACDAAEVCDGTGATCPSDQAAPDGTACDDGSACTQTDACQGGACQGANPVLCDDTNPCTDDACNPGSGACVFTPDDTNVCSDGNVCSTDACAGGACVHGASGVCTLGGSVIYYRDAAAAGSEPSTKPVPAVGIDATQDQVADTVTSPSGSFLTDDYYGSVSLTTTPKYGTPRASDHNDAITSFDASVAARAAALLVTLSPNQVIAADVTGDGTVSAFDASFVARFATELIDHFPVATATGSDWRFLRCDAYAYPGDPGCGAPAYDFTPIAQAETGKDFYAVLYGDVTGNWQPGAGFTASDATDASRDEEASQVADHQRAALLKERALPTVQGSLSQGPAELSLDGWSGALRRGERRQLTLHLQNADGVLALDLTFRHDSRIAIVAAQSTGIASDFSLVRSAEGGIDRVVAYGVLPLTGSGSLLTLTVEALEDTGGRVPLSVDGVANEGQVVLRVKGRPDRPARDRSR